jgi:PAS domain S-box-containing protein
MLEDIHGTAIGRDRRPTRMALQLRKPITGTLVRVVNATAPKWLELDAWPLIENAGTEPYGVMTTIRDVTERQEQVRVAMFHSTLLAAIGQAAAATDLEGRIVYWNTAAERLWGWSADEVLGRNIDDVVAWESTTPDASRTRVDIGDQPWRNEVCVRTRAGTVLRVLLTSAPVIDQSGLRIGNVELATDLSERVEHEERLAQFAALVESADDAIIALGPSGEVRMWNPAAAALYRVTADEALGRDIDEFDVFGDLSAADTIGRVSDVRSQHIRTSFNDPETGKVVHTQLALSRIGTTDHLASGTAVVARNITSLVELRRVRELERRRLRHAHRIAGLVSFTLDLDSRTIEFSDNENEPVPGGIGRSHRLDDLLPQIHVDDRLAVQSALAEASQISSTKRISFRVSDQDGAVQWFEALFAGEPGRPANISGVARDITTRAVAAQQQRHQATHDPLTGLPNRRLVEEHIAALLQKPHTAHRFGLLFLDLDRFKIVNDALGHLAGDQVLLAVADRLRAHVRSDDIVARYGGGRIPRHSPRCRHDIDAPTARRATRVGACAADRDRRHHPRPHSERRRSVEQAEHESRRSDSRCRRRHVRGQGSRKVPGGALRACDSK